MIEARTYYDESGNLVVEYKNNLLEYYPEVLTKIICEEKEKGLPADVRIERLSKNRINLVTNLKGRVTGSGDKLKLPTEVVDAINRVLNRFASEALEKRTRGMEIIPLKNYEVGHIKDDIRAMIENSRDLCVISDYHDYLKSRELPADMITMKQAYFKYLSEDYCNIAIAAESGDMEEVGLLVKDKLKDTEWM